MTSGSILLQFIAIIASLGLAISLPPIYETIRLVFVFIPFLILLNIIIKVITD